MKYYESSFAFRAPILATTAQAQLERVDNTFSVRKMYNETNLWSPNELLLLLLLLLFIRVVKSY